MPWTQDIVRMLSREDIIEYLAEVLDKMGFRNHEKVADRSRWGVDIVAVRDDPLAGTEKLLIKVHTADRWHLLKKLAFLAILLTDTKPIEGFLYLPWDLQRTREQLLLKSIGRGLYSGTPKSSRKRFPTTGSKFPKSNPKNPRKKRKKLPSPSLSWTRLSCLSFRQKGSSKP